MMAHIRRTIRAVAALALAAAIGIGVATPAAAAPCTSDCLAPGDYNERLVVGGVERTYAVHVPASYRGGTAVPLLLDLHGYTSDIAQQRFLSGQLRQSDLRGFIVVWPQGLNRSWNAYGCCGASLAGGVDDVGFLRTLVSTLKRRSNIDDARVYVTGLSNGGSMTHRLACEAADVFRAAAPVSFTLNREAAACRPSRPIPVVAFHGTSDVLVQYYGGLLFQSAPRSRDAWGQVDGCTGTPVVTPLRLGSRSEIFTNCRGGVRTGLVTILGGGHILYPNVSVDIAQYIWTNVFNQ
ncbi:hypothetical protein ASG29_15175 [Sphingomonas sp. Leaf412]|uniref:alpha/beta hydrolase family esterase n=1 Tax=Sphingomonas sp. Leaf412 TaxID=1736370 RepID=UPI0006F74D27|nr:PHB depolymerase family esterase [Sphingomonas sp. Leaf412]KQT31302.1 hypothetical protein ASG29_15175 [Sphingomonas sp. Leaf412]